VLSSASAKPSGNAGAKVAQMGIVGMMGVAALAVFGL
jgi:hypothetical protein